MIEALERAEQRMQAYERAQEHLHQLKQAEHAYDARKATFTRMVQRSYENAGEAQEAMERHLGRHGIARTERLLRDAPEAFGKIKQRPGAEASSVRGYAEAAARRPGAETLQAARQAYGKAERAVQQTRQAAQRFRRLGGPARGAVSQRLAPAALRFVKQMMRQIERSMSSGRGGPER